MDLPISTKRLVLRTFREGDLEAFLAYRNDPDVARYQAWEGISRDEAAAYLREHSEPPLFVLGEWQQIAIALGTDDTLIGDIGLCLHEDGRSAELGFTIATPHQRLGLAREALAELIDDLFAGTELERLDAVVDTRNLSAMRLLERLGFEVRSRARVEFKGEICEEERHVLKRGRFSARHT